MTGGTTDGNREKGSVPARLRWLLVFLSSLLLAVSTLFVFPSAPGRADEVSWDEYTANPVFDPADHRAYYPCVLYDPDGFSGHGASYYYKMWYGGYGGGHYEAVTYSNDGVNWTAPVELQGIDTNGYHAKVVYVPDGFGSGPYYYKIWYWDPDNLYSINAMRTADSADGVNWENDQPLTQDGTKPLVTGTWPDWNRGTYGPVAVLYNPGASNTGGNPFDYTFTMYYDGTTGGQEVIGLGYSADGNFWTRYGDDPVLDLGASGEWDDNYVTTGSVIPDIDGEWHLWYSGGSSAAHEGIGHATSPDGINWTKDPANPVLSINDGVPWRDVRTYTPSVLYSSTLFDGHGDEVHYKMWFSGRTNTPETNYAVGYATSKEPRMSLSKTADPSAEVEPGEEITYTLTASNSGSGTANSCTLTDVPPSHVTYVPSSTTLNGNPVPDSGGTSPLFAGMEVNSPGQPQGVIGPGETATVTFKVQVDDDAPDDYELVNKSTLLWEGESAGIGAEASNTVHVPKPDLSLQKTSDPPGNVTRGQVVTYTITADNNGDLPATGSLITDPLPLHTAYVSHSTTLNGTLVPDVNGSSPLFTGMEVNSPGQPQGVIGPGETATVTFQVQVGEDLPLGASLRNVATLQADGQEPVEASCITSSAAELPTTWYFAEGSTQEGFDEYILLTNLNDRTNTVDVTYITQDGGEQTFRHYVPPQSRRTIVVKAEMPDEAGIAVIVNGSQGLVCERSMYFNYRGITGGHDVIGANAPSLDLYFAEGYTGSEGSPFDEWILLLNPGLNTANVEIEYLFPGGGGLTKNYEVPPRTRRSIWVDQEVGEAAEVSAHIRSDQPVVAERSMYFIYNGKYPGGHCERAADSARNDWYLAEGYTGWEGSPFDEWILVSNNTDQEAEVTVTYMYPGGETQVTEHVAAARSRLTVNADAEVGEGKMISVHVHSNVPVVVERAMYFAYRGLWRGGHIAVGNPSPMDQLYFAEGYTGNPSSKFETWLLIQNTSDQTRRVRVEYILFGGEQVNHDLDLAPYSRTTVFTNEVLGQEALEFSMRVLTLDGSPTILAERAMYFDYMGSFGSCTGGHDVIGY
jgi:uncharacterized repeat protein (TIGR01451 family)